MQSHKKIIELRPFKDYNDFKQKVSNILNEKYIELLIHGGALDLFEMNHATLLNQNNLEQSGFEFFLDDYKKTEIKELTFNELKSNELEVLGLNLKYLHDDNLKNFMIKYNLEPINLDQDVIKTIGFIENIKVIQTKNGDEMAFVTFKSNILLDLIVFPNVYQLNKQLLDAPYVYIEATKNKKR